MLCCGIVAFIVAAVAASWRRLRDHPTVMLIGSGVIFLMLAVAMLATMAPTHTPHLSRENVIIMAMRSIC